MMTPTRLAVALAAAMLCARPSPARADVVESSAGGFTVKIAVQVSGSAMDAYRAAVDHVGAWWDSAHTWSGKSSNLSIDATAGGCFCERLPGGGGVRHLTVVYVDPGKLLRMNGGLGPLQDMAVNGSLTWTFAEAAGKSTIEMTYKVGGYAPGGLAALAVPVNGVLAQQLDRLKKFIETGAS
jgi:hypothetical protein